MLQELPNETIHQIASYLPLPSLIHRFGTSCKQFVAFARDPILEEKVKKNIHSILALSQFLVFENFIHYISSKTYIVTLSQTYSSFYLNSLFFCKSKRRIGLAF